MNSTVLTFMCLVTLAALIGGIVLAGMRIPAAEWLWLPATVAAGLGALSGVARQGEHKGESGAPQVTEPGNGDGAK